MGNDTSWRDQRREAAAAHAAALEHRRATESAQARSLLTAFVDKLVAQGIDPVPLRAQVVGTKSTYRTTLTGWYLRTNRSLGVTTTGDFYVLGTPPSLKSRLFGLRLLPTDPPLIIGQGARDGESIPLAQLLDRRYEELSR